MSASKILIFESEKLQRTILMRTQMNRQRNYWRNSPSLCHRWYYLNLGICHLNSELQSKLHFRGLKRAIWPNSNKRWPKIKYFYNTNCFSRKGIHIWCNSNCMNVMPWYVTIPWPHQNVIIPKRLRSHVIVLPLLVSSGNYNLGLHLCRDSVNQANTYIFEFKDRGKVVHCLKIFFPL